MRINREWKITGATLAGIIAVCTMIAAVPGIFSTVNSTSGYQVNGSAGSPGAGLCSDGTYYNTPCAVGAGFYQTVRSNAVDQAQEPKLNFSSQFVLTDSAGVSTNVAIPAISPTSTSTSGTITGGGAGCDNSSFSAAGTWYKTVDGVYHQNITGKTQTDCSSSPNNGAENIVLPHSCTTILTASVSNLAPTESTDDTHQGSQSLVSISTTTVVTQRYRSADHGASDSAPYITVECL